MEFDRCTGHGVAPGMGSHDTVLRNTAQARARSDKVDPFDDSRLVGGAPGGDVLRNRGQSSRVVSFPAGWAREPVTVLTATQCGSDTLVTADGTRRRDSRARGAPAGTPPPG